MIILEALMADADVYSEGIWGTYSDVEGSVGSGE